MIELLGNTFNNLSGDITGLIIQIIPIGLSIFGIFILIALARKLLFLVIDKAVGNIKSSPGITGHKRSRELGSGYEKDQEYCNLDDDDEDDD